MQIRKANIFKFGAEQKWVGKMCTLQPKTDRISETIRDRAKAATDIAYRKS